MSYLTAVKFHCMQFSRIFQNLYNHLVVPLGPIHSFTVLAQKLFYCTYYVYYHLLMTSCLLGVAPIHPFLSRPNFRSFGPKNSHNSGQMTTCKVFWLLPLLRHPESIIHNIIAGCMMGLRCIPFWTKVIIYSIYYILQSNLNHYYIQFLVPWLLSWTDCLQYLICLWIKLWWDFAGC